MMWPQNKNKRQFELMGTIGCHLCDDAEVMLLQHLDFNTTVVILVDIAESDVLLERYGVRIPVLRCPDHGQELDWPFDTHTLAEFLLTLN